MPDRVREGLGAEEREQWRIARTLDGPYNVAHGPLLMLGASVLAVPASSLADLQAERDRLQHERDGARGVARATHEAALEAMRTDHPLLSTEDHYLHDIGTFGHAYVIEGFAAQEAELTKLRASLGRAEEALREARRRFDEMAQTPYKPPIVNDWRLQLALFHNLAVEALAALHPSQPKEPSE